MIRVLTGAMLIDGTGAAPVPDAAVVVDGDRVPAAGARGALSWPNDAEVIDVRGRTIIPGLIDSHDHLAAHGYRLKGSPWYCATSSAMAGRHDPPISQPHALNPPAAR